MKTVIRPAEVSGDKISDIFQGNAVCAGCGGIIKQEDLHKVSNIGKIYRDGESIIIEHSKFCGGCVTDLRTFFEKKRSGQKPH